LALTHSRVQIENTPSLAVEEPRIELHFASLNLLVCVQIETEIAFRSILASL